MRAKHIKKIRAKMKAFLVLESHGMFGDFTYGREPFCTSVPFEHYTRVMARKPKEAAYRYMKRNHKLKDLNSIYGQPVECMAMFAKLRILPELTPYKRFITFWQ